MPLTLLSMFKNGCLYNLYACNIYGADSPINIELIGEKGRLRSYSRTWAITSWTAPMPRSETLMRPQMWALITGEAAITCRSVTSTVLSVRIFLLPSTDWKAEKPLEMVKGIYLSSARRERISLPFEDVTYSDLNQPVK